MKKQPVLLLASLFCLVSYASYGQFEKGDKLLNLGIGVNSYYNGGIPLSASFEVGVTDEISVGGGLDYLSYNRSASSVDYGFSVLYLGVRGSYHFNKLFNLDVEKLDLYGGASLGYRSFTWKDSSISGLSGTWGSGVFFGAHVGARYYFSPKLGGFLEVGAGGSGNARLGVALKF
jgi:hypothetical protein